MPLAMPSHIRVRNFIICFRLSKWNTQATSSDFEVQKDEWQKAIDKLKHLYDLEDEDERDEIKGAVDDLASTTDEVIEMMEYYLNNGDPDIDYLHLSFF